MQWAHPNVLAAFSLNYGSGLTRSICPYFLLMGPSGLSQNHGSNCTWVLLTTMTCSVSWAPPFVVSDERAFRHLNLMFGSSRITSSAYQKWPTRNSQSLSGPIKRRLVLTYLKFENRLRMFHPQGL